MRILYSHYLPTSDQPAGHMMRAIAAELRELGHEVQIHASAGDQPRGAEGVAIAKKSLSTLRAQLWFAKAIARDKARGRHDEEAVRQFRPDVLLVRQDPYCTSMTRAGARLGVPVVTYADAPAACEARQRNLDHRWHPPSLVEAIEARGLARCKAIIAVSNPAAQVLGQYKLAVPIHVIPNGIHPGRFEPMSDAERQRKRRELGLTAANIAGFQGTFQSIHGIHHLADLMLATAQHSDLEWLLIGDGRDRKWLEEKVRGRVKAVFLGHQPGERVGELLGLIDIAVAPYSRTSTPFYGCPLKVLEYAAAGCAIIASDQGDIPHLLDEGRAGIVLPSEDTAAWANEFHGLLVNPIRRRAFGEAARAMAHSQYTWKHCAIRVEGVLRQACDNLSVPARAEAGTCVPATRIEEAVLVS